MKSELKAKVIAFVCTALVLSCGIIKNNIFNDSKKQVERNQILAMESYTTYDIENDVNSFINDNYETFEFYANTFGITLDNLKESIISKNTNNTLNKQDIGNTNTIYDNLDKNIIDYLFNLKKENSKLFKQTYSDGNDYSKEYVYGLLNYYSNIYNNVDFDILAAIAYIESGNLNSNYMMACNNIFGGMSSSGLIKYQNIEYGVLSFVKLMSEKYYAKGLDTVEKIARVYNPNSTTWTTNVRNTTSKFNNYDNIENLSKLISLKGGIINE